MAMEDSGFEVTEVLSGCARGADRLGEIWAAQRGIPVRPFPADWDQHGKAAGHIRNRQMAAEGEGLVALLPSDAKAYPAKGTRDMIAQAERWQFSIHVRTVVMHRCHANACAREAHREAPFCERHAKRLPEKLWKAIWSGRRRDRVCGVCDPRQAEEVRLRARPNWAELVNLAIAALVVLEFEDCGAPEGLQDEESFCWCCGVYDHSRTYKRAQRAAGDARPP